MRKRSQRIALVLLGTVAVVGCQEENLQRKVYASHADCIAENTVGDCEQTEVRGHNGTPYYYGPRYNAGALSSGNGLSGGSVSSPSRAIGVTSVPRGGFGSTAHAVGGFGGS